MIDLAAETKAYVEIITEAEHRIEALQGELMDSLGQWDQLFAQAFEDLTQPQDIAAELGQFDHELEQVTQAIQTTLCAELTGCESELGNYATMAGHLQEQWGAEVEGVHSALAALTTQLGQLQGDLEHNLTDGLAATLAHCQQLLAEAVQPFVDSGEQWMSELQGSLNQSFGQAWQEFSQALSSEHSATAQQFIDAASGDAGAAFQQFVESALAALGDLSTGVGASMEALSSHVGDHVSQGLQEAIQNIINTAVHEMSIALAEAIGIATVGEAITTAMAGSGVLEVLIPLNRAIEAILRAIEIFKNPTSLLGF